MDQKASHYHLRGRVWIEGPGGTFLGHGRVLLLEKIAELGSISAAARAMEMSYRHAWELVDSMNRESEQPVVAKTTGGKGGGGARLTDTGVEAIALYRETQADFETYLAERGRQLKL